MKKYIEKLNGSIPKKGKEFSQCARTYGIYGCHQGPIKGQGSNPVNTDISIQSDTDRRDHIVIYESEFRVIAGIVASYGRIECSMNGFGFWTRGGRFVILLVIAPGPKSIQTACYCEQDIEFFKRVSEIIETKLGIQWGMEAHHHHGLGLQEPSNGDIHQVQRLTSRNNFWQWVDLITTFENAGHTSRLFGRRPQNTGRWKDFPRIKIKAFLYTDPQHGEKREVAFRIISGPSPQRLQALATGILDPADIGEYASDFPMEKISDEPFDFEQQYCNQADQVPDSLALAEQCSQLPEQVRKNIKIYVNGEQGLVTVVLPLPDGSIAGIGYEHKAPHLIRSVSIQNNSDTRDVTEALVCDKRNISLNRIYEALVNCNNRKENKDVDAETV
jgi:hypothetical protein